MRIYRAGSRAWDRAPSRARSRCRGETGTLSAKWLDAALTLCLTLSMEKHGKEQRPLFAVLLWEGIFFLAVNGLLYSQFDTCTLVLNFVADARFCS